MRYFSFVLQVSSEQIKNVTINLREYAYQNPVAAMNNYMHQHINNGICYFAYREECEVTLAVFSYDEKKWLLCDAYDYILEMLNVIFCIKKVKDEPCEITMYQFYEYLLEARRRDYCFSWARIAEAANVILFDWYKNEPHSFHYILKEKIISENSKKENPMYDKSLINELLNIESHKNVSEFKGNMHYIISTRSAEAANDITEALMQRLAAANRLSGRHMEIISEIEPDLYKVNNHLEEFIENNYGGVIVIDLSEKFGYEPVDYEMTCKYIDKLVKITDAAMEKLKNIYAQTREDSGFGNGRFVRNMLEEAEMNLAERVAQLDESKYTTKLITTIEEGDIPDSDMEKYYKKKPIGFGVA